MKQPFTVAAFCDWWIQTVLLLGGEQARATAYLTAADIAADPLLRAIEQREAALT